MLLLWPCQDRSPNRATMARLVPCNAHKAVALRMVWGVDNKGDCMSIAARSPSKRFPGAIRGALSGHAGGRELDLRPIEYGCTLNLEGDRGHVNGRGRPRFCLAFPGEVPTQPAQVSIELRGACIALYLRLLPMNGACARLGVGWMERCGGGDG